MEVSILPDLDVVLEDLRFCAGVEVLEWFFDKIMRPCFIGTR